MGRDFPILTHQEKERQSRGGGTETTVHHFLCLKQKMIAASFLRNIGNVVNETTDENVFNNEDELKSATMIIKHYNVN